MKIICPNCRKIYKLNAEKLPQARKIAFHCKACKCRIELNLFPEPKLTEKQPEHAPGKKLHTKPQPAGIALKYGILRAVSDLPVMPHVVSKAQTIMADPKASLKTLASVVEVEPAIAAKVLKIANSAYYGLRGKVSTIQHALVVLGEKVLGELITMAGVSNIINKKLKGYHWESGDLWKHSIAVAIGSGIIARKIRPELEKTAFFAGLIHDVGKIILDQYVYERREIFEDFLQDNHKSFPDAEKHILGFDHSDLAAEFCEKWNIPETQATAIRFHHDPSHSNGNELAYILHVADAIAFMNTNGGIDGNSSMFHGIEKGTTEFLGLMEEDIDDIKSEVTQSVDKISDELSLAHD